MKCTRCDHQFARGAKCPSCNYWNFSEEVEEFGRAKLDIKPEDFDDGTVILDDAKSSDHDRIDVAGLNYIFGGGLVRTSTNLISGGPGAGKSSLMLQLADRILDVSPPDSEFLYINAEEATEEIKARKDRLLLKHGRRIRMLPAMNGVPNLGLVIQKRDKLVGLALDSVQRLVGDENDMGAVKVCQILKSFSVSRHFPSMIVSHVTKSDDFAGLMKMQHEVDGTFTLNPIEDDELNALREMESKKNRFGPSFITSYFLMTATGLKHYQPPEETTEETEESEDE